MALPAGAPARRLSLAPDDPRVSAYLAGADVPSAGAQGYLRVEVDGFPLGWGKRSGASVRSLLPKGLR
jgi:NOL1/NOP2/fmu family ribosome biogenesis protein